MRPVPHLPVRGPRAPRVRQHDVTDCGAACLYSVARRYGLTAPIARIRQLAFTDQKGTNLLGMIEAATRLGFTAKGVKGPPEALDQIPLPAIAHVIVGGQLHHYVVIYAASTRRVTVMDPADGRVHRRARAEFLTEWTGVLLLLAPGAEFQPGQTEVGTAARFSALAHPHRAVLLQALVGAIAYTVLGLSNAVYVQKIVDRVIVDGNRNLLNLLSVAMLAVVAAEVYLGYAKGLLTLRTGQRMDAALILGYYRHLLHLPQRFFDTMRVGEVISRVNDAVKIRVFINNALLGLVVDVLVVVFSLALMLAYSWKLALVVVTTVPAYGAVFWVANRFNRRNQRRLMERSADLEAQLVESLGAAATLKRFGVEEMARLRTESRLVGLLRPVYRAGRMGLAAGGATELVSRGSTVALLWIGTGFVLARGLTPGELMSFYALVGYLTGPVTGLIGANQTVQDALIAADRLFEILDLECEPAGEGISLTPAMAGDIHFRDVRFRYGTRTEVFQGLNLRIVGGKITAVVGESGSGKSTLGALLQGLYPLDGGSIQIGGHDVRHVTRASLRRVVGVVPQQVDVFSGTVTENIALGDPEPDHARLLALCAELGITEFVERLPLGFETQLGEHGATLSGGQGQRLTIARALYRAPAVLVLDEATSALDAVAERFVQRTLQRFRAEGKTVVLIAHRLSSVMSADRIIVLGEGRVVEEGTHRELLQREGRYYRLWNHQFGGMP
ncbi:MAG TPA: peptidase domain-containing ABC transporter, partial [Longimicrobiaceae bacterium]|nr:peptidase domain-containing ABC transporter [Longimicrobiaceae bacterium]